MIQRRFFIAALMAMVLSLGAIAFADTICPNPNCPHPEDCPGAVTGECPYAGQGPRDGSGQGQGPYGDGDCPYDGQAPRDGSGQGQGPHGGGPRR